MGKQISLYADGKIPLNKVQLGLLKAMSKQPPGTWFTARRLAAEMDLELLLGNRDADDDGLDSLHETRARDLFASNKCGPIMSYMKKQGLVISRPNPQSEDGARTLYALGPVADVLKESGDID